MAVSTVAPANLPPAIVGEMAGEGLPPEASIDPDIPVVHVLQAK
jgi:hypothetical protein